MAHLKIMNASRGPIHKYENLKRKLQLQRKYLFYTICIVQFSLKKDTYDLKMAYDKGRNM
jgi:hypothetical protein